MTLPCRTMTGMLPPMASAAELPQSLEEQGEVGLRHALRILYDGLSVGNSSIEFTDVQRSIGMRKKMAMLSKKLTGRDVDNHGAKEMRHQSEPVDVLAGSAGSMRGPRSIMSRAACPNSVPASAAIKAPPLEVRHDPLGHVHFICLIDGEQASDLLELAVAIQLYQSMCGIIS